MTTRTLLNIWEYHYASDFAAGVRLLVDHDGGKHLTKQTFQRLQMLAVAGTPVDAYNLGKLTSALQKIDIKDSITIETGQEPKPAITVWMAPKQEEIPAEKPEHSAKAISLLKEQSHYHALMVAADNDKQRGEYAGEILRISGELDDEYDRLRGDNPMDMPPPRKAAKAADGLRRLHSLRSRIARLINQLIPQASGPRKAELEKELEMKKAEAQRLVTELS